MDLRKFKRDRANELQQLNELLVRSVPCCINAHVLVDASHGLWAVSKDHIWAYSLDKLAFRIIPPQQTLPKNLKLPIDVMVSLNIQGICVEENEHCSINSLALDIEVVSLEDGHKRISAWHFDRHIEGESDNPPADSHPHFHFQHGGKKMEEHLAEQVNSILLTAAPRIPFPPMDASLAIDFVLSNFCGADWRKLRGDVAYRHIVKSSQNRLWRPYFKMISNFWESDVQVVQDKSMKFWPNLLT